VAVMILTARPAPVDEAESARHRIYHCHTEMMALTKPTGDAMLELGAMTPYLIKELAYRANISSKQAIRWLQKYADIKEHGEPEPKDELPPGFLKVLARKNGSVALALRSYFDHDTEQIKRVRSSIYRAIEKFDLNFLMALKAGEDKWERFLEVGVYEPDHANEIWQMDEMHIPIRCRLANGQIIETLYLISIVDSYSGLVLNAQVTLGPSDAVIASAVLARAIAGGELKGVTYGGDAEALAMDNAFVFSSNELLSVLLLAAIKAKYARPYTPTDKADVERYHGVIKMMYLMGVTGWTHGPAQRRWDLTGDLDPNGKPKRARVEVSMSVPPDDADLLTVEQVTQAVYAAIHQHNTEHVNSSTGQTAIVRY
jgi:hypothetical protein